MNNGKKIHLYLIYIFVVIMYTCTFCSLFFYLKPWDALFFSIFIVLCTLLVTYKECYD